MTVVVLVNGPPRVGKDTAAEGVLKHFLFARMLKFSDPVKNGTHAAYGLHVGTNYFEMVKDEPQDCFFGLTPRQAYIAHSEKYMKPMHGKNVYGKIFVNRLREMWEVPLIVTPDSGFVDEATPVIAELGPDHILLIRLHREGCNFERDSRGYLDLPSVRTINIENRDDKATFQTIVVSEVSNWLKS